jgi:hypothetical protein
MILIVHASTIWGEAQVEVEVGVPLLIGSVDDHLYRCGGTGDCGRTFDPGVVLDFVGLRFHVNEHVRDAGLAHQRPYRGLVLGIQGVDHRIRDTRWVVAVIVGVAVVISGHADHDNHHKRDDKHDRTGDP